MHKQVFGSVAEMIEACDAAFKAGRRRRTDDKLRGEGYWIGREFSGWADVVRKAGEVWPEGVALVEGMLDGLRDAAGGVRPKSRVRKSRWSPDDGDEIDNDRLRAGQDYWRQTVREERDAPQTLVIVFSFTTSSSRDSEEVLWRGAAAIILADLLEAAGYRVELWAVNYCKTYDGGGYVDMRDALQAVRLKASESPVDVATLVNGVSGWFYRTVLFQSYHVIPVKTQEGLGHPVTITEETEIVRELAGNARVVVIDNVWSRTAATAKVREVLDRMS
jgi:hypothetical protein